MTRLVKIEESIIVDIDRIATYIIDEVIANTSDCQYIVFKDEIEKKFDVVLDIGDTSDIENEIGSREEVLDVLYVDYGFDVVVGTAYIPNYGEY